MQRAVGHLQSLPKHLLELVLRFLSVREKMLQVIHLSTALARLTPAACSEAA
jgi:hypothetical protein